MRFRRFLENGGSVLNSDNGAGGGATPPSPPAPPATPPPSDTSPNLAEVERGYKNELARRSNNADDLARQLYSETYQLREDKRKLNAQLAEMAAKPFITDEERSDLDAYKQLGKPQDLADQLKQLTGIQRQNQVRTAAKAAGFDPDALVQLGGQLDYAVDQVNVKQGDQTISVEQAVVVTKDAAGKEVRTPLDQYAETNWKHFLSVLKPTGNQQQQQQQQAPRPTVPATGPVWPSQQSSQGTTGTPTNPVDAFLQKQGGPSPSSENPFAPKPPAS